MPSETSPRGTALGRHSSVLLAHPAWHDPDEVCLDLLAEGLGAEDAVIFVLSDRTPDARLQSLRAHVSGPMPGHLGCLTLGDAGRSAGDTVTADGEVWVRGVASPGSLTDIGVTLSNRISHWGARSTVSVCFEPVGALLEHADVSDVYRFMHVFGQQVRAVDGRVHYHLDPSAHDDVVVHQLSSLCEAMVRINDDETISVVER